VSATPCQYLYEDIRRAKRRVSLERRLLILPIAWAIYGLLLVLGIQFLLGPIANNIPYNPNDKPIGGSVLPVLFFNVAAILGIITATLYSVGYWTPSLSSRQSKIELGAVGVFLASGFLAWYSGLFLFTGAAAIVTLMAVNIN